MLREQRLLESYFKLPRTTTCNFHEADRQARGNCERRRLIGKSETRRSAPKSGKLRSEMRQRKGEVVGGSGKKRRFKRFGQWSLNLRTACTPPGDRKANATNEYSRAREPDLETYRNIDYRSFELIRDTARAKPIRCVARRSAETRKLWEFSHFASAERKRR